MNKMINLKGGFKMKNSTSPLKQMEEEPKSQRKGIHKEEGKGYVPDQYEPSTEILSVKGEKVSRLYKDSKGNVVSSKKFGSAEDVSAYRKFQADSTATMKGREYNAGMANLEEAASKAMNTVFNKKKK